jgi:tetratricopeptide (TPR) repeat protein
MIVKNESHIILNVLSSTLPLISTYCIVDTGSSDNTVEIIYNFYLEKGIVGVIHERPWKNFGHNRSEALSLCKNMDYALVIDADDIIDFPADGLKTIQRLIGVHPNACNVLVKQDTIEYWRTQIFKCNDDWKYIGVLHEYPSNGKLNNIVVKLPPSVFITSRRMGGRNLTGDKYKRDIEVLEKGLEEEPENERYIFYLAQSYRDAGDNQNAIKFYKKRFEMKGWHEEAWFSAFQVGLCYKNIGNILKFEYWMQKAFNFYPSRAEPIYYLTKYFRETNRLYKAYEYCKLGLTINFSKNDVLFIEPFPHKGGFIYEKSILDFYMHANLTIGLRDSMCYLIINSDNSSQVIENLKFYIKPILSTIDSSKKREYVSSHHIEKWSPLTINASHIEAPILFNLLNGPTYAIDWNSELLAITHITDSGYYCFIRFDRNYTPLAVTLPFLLKENASGVYNSIYSVDNSIVCSSSDEADALLIEYSTLDWIMFEKNCTD